MARPPTIKTEDIVEASRRLFLEHGFGTSTATIARELGISEGTIYKRFETKERLFQAAMGLPDCSFARAWPALAGQAEVPDNLLGIGREVVGFFRRIIPRVIMLSSQPGCPPGELVRQRGREAPPIVIASSITAYLEAEKDLGRVDFSDAEAAARLLLGSLHNAVFFETVGLGGPLAGPREGDADDRSVERWIHGAVDTLWNGIAP